MTRENFKGTCTLPEHPSGERPPAWWAHLAAHGHPDSQSTREDRTMTFTDPDAYAAHMRLSGLPLRTYRQPLGRPFTRAQWRPNAKRDAAVLQSAETVPETDFDPAGYEHRCAGPSTCGSSAHLVDPEPAEAYGVTEANAPSNYRAPETVAALESGRLQVITVTAPTTPCEVDDCDEPASPCDCGAAHCPRHPHEAPSLTRQARRAWNRAASELARAQGVHAALMARWDAAQALRDSGADPASALALVTS